jgi:hypothetical protein
MVQNRHIRPYQSDGPPDPAKEIDDYVDTPLAMFFEDFITTLIACRCLGHHAKGASALADAKNRI